MTLFKLALLNVRNNLENYTVYFMSMAFNITIYYLFASLRFSQAVRLVVEREQELELFFNVSSVVVAFFAVLSVWFLTAFFLRRRRSELAIYGLVGMTRHQVGALLFFETFLAGGAALASGLRVNAGVNSTGGALVLPLSGFGSVMSRYQLRERDGPPGGAGRRRWRRRWLPERAGDDGSRASRRPAQCEC